MPMQKRVSMGKGKGFGHGGNTKLPDIQERPLPPELMIGLEPGTKRYQLGKCSILVSPPYLNSGWHMSIAHSERYPTWDEIAKARYELLPDGITMAMILPSAEQYVNLHSFCFQLRQVADEYANL